MGKNVEKRKGSSLSVFGAGLIAVAGVLLFLHIGVVLAIIIVGAVAALGGYLFGKKEK